MKKFISFSFFLILTFLLLGQSVQAADLRVAGKGSGNVSIGQDEIIKSLYTAGNIVSIDADVEKSVHAAGNVVTINGDVGGSVYSGAATLVINGNVSGSVHGGAGSLIINGNVFDDLFMAGGNIVVSETASVKGDFYTGGGTIDIEGPISGDVFMGAGTVNINSEIFGNVKIYSADEIRLGEQAIIHGNLEYRSDDEIEMIEGATVLGQTIKLTGGKFGHEDREGKSWALFGFISAFLLIKIVAVIIVGLILVFLFNGLTRNIVEEGLRNFWKSLGIGLLFFIVIPIAILILFISFVGFWLGIIVGALYLTSLLLASTIAGIVCGSWLLKLIKKEEGYRIDWKVVVLGILVFAVVGFIPFIGWLILTVFTLTTLGAMYRLAYRIRR